MTTKKIIVCDDQAIFRELTASYLHLKGWEVLRASTGEECLALAADHAVEAILLDVQMPGIGGYETVKRLRENKVKAEIILMTGFSQHNHQIIGEIPKSDAMLLKPFNLRALQELLMSHMQNKNLSPQEKRVLVVDDEDLLREMLTIFLRKSGFQVVSARDGQECVEKARKENFLAIFMDIRMPNLDGLSALKNLRQKGIETPVVLMSGFCELSSVDEAKQSGALAFLAKPFKPAKALELLKTEIVGLRS